MAKDETHPGQHPWSKERETEKETIHAHGAADAGVTIFNNLTTFQLTTNSLPTNFLLRQFLLLINDIHMSLSHNRPIERSIFKFFRYWSFPPERNPLMCRQLKCQLFMRQPRGRCCLDDQIYFLLAFLVGGFCCCCCCCCCCLALVNCGLHVVELVVVVVVITSVGKSINETLRPWLVRRRVEGCWLVPVALGRYLWNGSRWCWLMARSRGQRPNVKIHSTLMSLLFNANHDHFECNLFS